MHVYDAFKMISNSRPRSGCIVGIEKLTIDVLKGVFLYSSK